MEKDNYEFFLRRFKKYLGSLIKVYAYCLMPNHFHFFIQIREHVPDERKSNLTVVEKAFKDFFISYAKAINKRFDRTGALFQYKFKRKIVDREDYFTWLVFYIHANPLEANLASDFEKWWFSSYKYLLSKRESAIAREEVLNWFGSKDAFIRFHLENLEEVHNQMRLEKIMGI